MATNKEVAEAFATKKGDKKSDTMFIEGDIIYSYGYHFPIAYRVGDLVFFNVENYSNTTAKHKSLVLSSLGRNKGYRKLIFVSLNQMKQLTNSVSDMINLTFEEYETETLLKYLKNNLLNAKVKPLKATLFINRLKKEIDELRFIENI